MAVTLTITDGIMKIEGVFSNPVFVPASQGNFQKNSNLEYEIYDKVYSQEYKIGDAANVNGGITDAALEGLLSGFFAKASTTGGAVSSVFGRTGTVVAVTDDYTKEQITGLKITDTPTFSGLSVTGDVGIGTASPHAKLHVDGKGAFGDSITSASMAIANRSLNLISTDAVMNISRISANIDSASPALEMAHFTSLANAESGTYNARWDIFLNSTGLVFRDRKNGNLTPLVIEETSGSNALYIASGGNIGINTSSPSVKLDVLSTDSTLIKLDGSTGLTTGQTNINFSPNGTSWLTGAGGSAETDAPNSWFVWNSTGYTVIIAGDGHIRFPQQYGFTSAAAANLSIDANGWLWRSTSSKKIKKNINYKGVSPELALKLKPVSFDEKRTGESHIGFIAEDCRDIDSRLASDGGEEDLPGLELNAIVAALTALVQQQQIDINELKKSKNERI